MPIRLKVYEQNKIMLKNYFKIAWRNLWKNKLFSFINIIGLAVGVTCCVLIYLYVQHELSYDTYNEKADRIYRITSHIKQQSKDDVFAPTSPVTSQKLQSAFPEIQKIVRFSSVRRPVTYNDRQFYDTKILYADSTLLDIFTLPLVEGVPQKIFRQQTCSRPAAEDLRYTEFNGDRCNEGSAP